MTAGHGAVQRDGVPPSEAGRGLAAPALQPCCSPAHRQPGAGVHRFARHPHTFLFLSLNADNLNRAVYSAHRAPGWAYTRRVSWPLFYNGERKRAAWEQQLLSTVNGPGIRRYQHRVFIILSVKCAEGYNRAGKAI